MKKKAETNPRDTARTQSTDQFLEFIKKNKTSIIVTLIAVVLIFSITMFYVNYSKDRQNQAWSEFVQATAAAVDAKALQSTLDEIAGTSAEPWALYLLSIKEFKEGNLASARASFDELENNYPDHYLFKNPELAPNFKEKLTAEQNWTAQHPLSMEIPLIEENPATEEEGADQEGAPSEENSGNDNPVQNGESTR